MDDMGLDGPLNLVGTEASGTGVHMARSTVNNCLDPLHIGLPGTVGTSVRVRNLNTKGHTLATIITLSHSFAPPNRMINHENIAHFERLDMIPKNSEKCKHFFAYFLFFYISIDILPLGRYNEPDICEKRGA